MSRLTLASRARLRRLTPHTRAHAEQLLGEYPGLQVSSGRRSAARNRQVGGARRSFHLRGRAVDLTGPLPDLVRASGAAWALRVGPMCTGPEEVLLERPGLPGQHLHIAW